MAQVMAQRGPTAAPYFSLARAEWIPYACALRLETGESHRVEGPPEFATYRAAVEASRFLVAAACLGVRSIPGMPTNPSDEPAAQAHALLERLFALLHAAPPWCPSSSHPY